MAKKHILVKGNQGKDIDLHEIFELIDLGTDKEEISKEFGISKKYINRMIDNYYEDYQGEYK